MDPDRSSRTGQMEKPKILTPRRVDILQAFLLEVQQDLTKFGSIGGDIWMEEILKRLRGPNNRYSYLKPFDVQSWLESKQFAKVYERLKELQRKQDALIASASSAPNNNPQTEGSSAPTQMVQLPQPPVSFTHVQVRNAGAVATIGNEPQPPSFSMSEHDFKRCSTECNATSEKVDPGEYLFMLPPPPPSLTSNHLNPTASSSDLSRNFQHREQQRRQLDVNIEPRGILVQVPPSDTTQAFIIQHATWNAFGQENMEPMSAPYLSDAQQVVLDNIKTEPSELETD